MQTYQFTLTGVANNVLDTIILPEAVWAYSYCTEYSILSCCGNGRVRLQFLEGATRLNAITLGSTLRHWTQQAPVGGNLLAAFQTITSIQFEELATDRNLAGCVVDLKICLTLSDNAVASFTCACTGTCAAEQSYVDVL